MSQTNRTQKQRINDAFQAMPYGGDCLLHFGGELSDEQIAENLEHLVHTLQRVAADNNRQQAKLSHIEQSLRGVAHVAALISSAMPAPVAIDDEPF